MRASVRVAALNYLTTACKHTRLNVIAFHIYTNNQIHTYIHYTSSYSLFFISEAGEEGRIKRRKGDQVRR